MMLQQHLLRIKMTLYAGIVTVKDTYDGHKCMKELKKWLNKHYFKCGLFPNWGTLDCDKAFDAEL